MFRLKFLRQIFAGRLRRRNVKPPSTACVAPETLEVRSLLTTLNWTAARNLTISFAPDGTDVAGNSNQLNQMLDAIAPRSTWQKTITSAFEAWLADVGLNLQVVADNGDAFGIAGATYGDTRFGDVRVAAVPLSDNALATAIPGDQLVSGTWASDIMFNSKDKLKTLDEVYALALHEAGHVLGLGHSTDPNSPMFANAGTVVHQPTSQDRQTLHRQLLAGGAAEEADEDRNDSLSGAQPLTASASSGLDPHFETTGEIIVPTDRDTFQFRPADLGQHEDSTATIVLDTRLNGLIPRVTIVGSDGKAVETIVVANGNGRVVLQAKDTQPSRNYFVVVESAARTSPNSVGRYRLSVSFTQSIVKMDRLAAGKITAPNSHQALMLYSAKSQVVNFVLSAKGSTRRPSAVVLSVYDSSDILVYRTAAGSGDTVTGRSVLLRPGEYRIAIDGVTPAGVAFPDTEYVLKGIVVSIDAGPLASNPTLNPAYGTGGTSPYVFPNDVVSSRPINVQEPPTPPVLPPTRPAVVWDPWLLMYPWLVGLQ